MLRITPDLKKKLRKPFGKVFKPQQRSALKNALEGRFVIAVGDATVKKLCKLGVTPNIGVYDLKTRREPLPRAEEKFFEELEGEKIIAVNPAGYITPSLERAVQRCLKTPGLCKLFVIGEEDLATLVFLMHSYRGVVCYGQPGRGMVVVEASQDIRQQAKKLYNEFKSL